MTEIVRRTLDPIGVRLNPIHESPMSDIDPGSNSMFEDLFFYTKWRLVDVGKLELTAKKL